MSLTNRKRRSRIGAVTGKITWRVGVAGFALLAAGSAVALDTDGRHRTHAEENSTSLAIRPAEIRVAPPDLGMRTMSAVGVERHGGGRGQEREASHPYTPRDLPAHRSDATTAFSILQAHSSLPCQTLRQAAAASEYNRSSRAM